jgi:hypothetical protein
MSGEIELLGHHSDDGVRSFIDCYRLARDFRIGVEVGFQTRQDCESARLEAAGGDSDRANHRQPQQQDLPLVELPGLLEGVRAQPCAVQDRGRSAGGWI